MFTNKTIYQAIWDADQSKEGNGIPAIRKSDTVTPRDKERGYAIVDETEKRDLGHTLFPEVEIPNTKTYDLCQSLFRFYNLQETTDGQGEVVTLDETKEINEFIDEIVDTAPMKVAKSFLQPDMEEAEWKRSIYNIWFTMGDSFRKTGNQRSGFEHVFIGEKKTNGGLGGYHYWHKFYLDDGAKGGKDTIDYEGVNYGFGDLNKAGMETPEVVTLKYNWDALDTPDDESDDLKKPKGGFWVGCSPECLMALGMILFEQNEGSGVIINNVEYDLKLFKLTNNKAIDTFYPIFKRTLEPVDEPPIGEPPIDEPPIDEPPIGEPPIGEMPPGNVRVICALINPEGDDVGKETVTLVNISNVEIDINEWTIVDRNGKETKLDDRLDAGQVQTINLSGRGAQLGNKGTGKIILKDNNNQVIHQVSYKSDKEEWSISTRKDAQEKKNGFTVLF